jgi:hypothetical protein
MPPRCRGCQVDLRLFGAHASGEVPVGGGDADLLALQAAEGVGWSAQACRAGRLTHVGAGLLKDVPECFAVVVGGLELLADQGCSGNDIGLNAHLVAFDDLCRRFEIGYFAAGAGADVGAREPRAAHLRDGRLVVGRVRFGHHGLQVGAFVAPDAVVFGVRVVVERREIVVGALAHVVEGDLVGLDDAVLAAAFDHHVGQGHAALHIHVHHAVTGEFHRTVGGPIHPDISDDLEDEVLGHDVRRDLAFEDELHGLGDLDPELAGAEDEPGVGVADAGGELSERAGGAGVRIGAEEHIARTREAFLGHGHVADTLVSLGAHVIVVGKVLVGRKGAQDVDVPVGVLVVGEDVVVGDDDHLVLVPYAGISPNSRLKMPMVGGPQTSCVIRISTFTQTVSPASTWVRPAALARIFSVKVIDMVY